MCKKDFFELILNDQNKDLNLEQSWKDFKMIPHTIGSVLETFF